VRVWGSAGFLGTVLAAGAWFDWLGMRSFPLITTATLVAIVVATRYLPDLREPAHPSQEQAQMWPVLRQRHVQWFLGALFFHVLAHMGIYMFFSLYLDSLGYGKTVIGLLWAVAVLAEIAWFYTQGRWMPMLSLTAWLVLSAAATALRMGVTAAAAATLPLLVLAQLLNAITFAAHHGATIGLISQYFPGRLRGRGQALFTVVAYGVPGVLGGLLGGALSARMGLQSVFWACTASSLLAAGLAFRVWRGRHATATG